MLRVGGVGDSTIVGRYSKEIWLVMIPGGGGGGGGGGAGDF